jgi:hypothetical protein
MPKLMYHDAGCKAFLDRWGRCPECKYCPDSQSLGIKEVTNEELTYRLDRGETFMGPYRTPIPGPTIDLLTASPTVRD